VRPGLSALLDQRWHGWDCSPWNGVKGTRLQLGVTGLGAFSQLVLSGLGLVWFVLNRFVKMLLRPFQLRKPSCREPVEKTRSVRVETVGSELAVSRLSGTAHVAERVGQEHSGREKTLSGVCVRNLGTQGTDVWLQYMWKGPCWECLSRK